jgi:hypothetical protein
MTPTRVVRTDCIECGKIVEHLGYESGLDKRMPKIVKTADGDMDARVGYSMFSQHFLLFVGGRVAASCKSWSGLEDSIRKMGI